MQRLVRVCLRLFLARTQITFVGELVSAQCTNDTKLEVNDGTGTCLVSIYYENEEDLADRPELRSGHRSALLRLER